VAHNEFPVKLISFSNRTKEDRKLLNAFVGFPWDLYRGDPHFIPLFDFEYLGLKILGIKGYYQPDNLFYRHADIRFFLAFREGKAVGRCIAFKNDAHNRYWKDRVGFFGEFESINEKEVSDKLFDAAASWLKSNGMDTIRGPQNLLVNESTPGLLTSGFDSRPVVHYHYNKPYYRSLIGAAGFREIRRVFSWEVPVMNPMEERLEQVAKKVIKRYGITLEPWSQRPYRERRREMLDIYNDAWSENFGFVPFTEEEWYEIVDDMKLIMDKGLSLFVYVKGEPAAFFGGIPNIAEKMAPGTLFRRFELLRIAKMFLLRKSVKGFRLGYLGVKKKFQRLGLDGVMLWKQKQYTQNKGYEYCDIGWILEGNVIAQRMAAFMNSTLSKVYTIFEKPIE
jgi:hypothetical protein